MKFEEIRSKLVDENEEFRELDKRHREYDRMLQELTHRKYLTPDDQLREVELKKKKLALKDQMLKIALEYEQRENA